MTKVVGVRFRQVGKIYFFAPGQAVVLYDGDYIAGGGVII